MHPSCDGAAYAVEVVLVTPLKDTCRELSNSLLLDKYRTSVETAESGYNTIRVLKIRSYVLEFVLSGFILLCLACFFLGMLNLLQKMLVPPSKC